MRVALLTNVVSPHQLPLARALVARVGEDEYRYISSCEPLQERVNMGWEVESAPWCIQAESAEARDWLEKVPILYAGNRAIDLFERRVKQGLKTLYTAERWFKPRLGFLRLLVPSYFRMAWRFCRCAEQEAFWCLPMGIHAARDMARLRGLFRGQLRCLFRAPKLAFESQPGGVVVPLEDAIAAGVLNSEQIDFACRHGFVQIPKKHWGMIKPGGLYARMRIWGYFVSPGRGEGGHALPIKHPPRALWVGRMLDWKRVGDLVRACRPDPDLKREGIPLDLYGHGPEECVLRRLAKGKTNIRFHDFIPVSQVREVMRAHDCYVLPSNAYEGWGAVINEALEEGMCVLATVESGAGATLLPPENLFSAGSWQDLAERLCSDVKRMGIGSWTADNAAAWVLSIA